MISVRLVDAPSFAVVGRKTWIAGQDNAAFGAFWQACRQDGLIDRLRALRGGEPGPITDSLVLGVSCVERDPSDRAFDFYVAAESGEHDCNDALERYVVPAATWAVFENRGPLPEALIAAEMYAFMEWLPASGYRHALAPELEVYPARGDDLAEFWLPVEDA